MSEFTMTAGDYVQAYNVQEDKWLYFVAIIHGQKSTGYTQYLFTEDIRVATKCTAAQWVAECLSHIGFISTIIKSTEVKNEAEQTVA